MKKILLLVACMAVFSGAMAQRSGFGVKAGLNLATMTNRDGEIRPNFNVGFFGEYVSSDLIGFQLEAVFSRQGMNGKDNSALDWIRLEYINVPILLKLYLVKGLSFEIGPQLGFLLGSRYQYTFGGYSHRINGDYKSFDVSAAVGLSYQIDHNFFVNVRYNAGLTELEELRMAQTQTIGYLTEDTKNSVIQIGLGWKF